jgi:uncharacterized protein (TIGR02217 family)
MSFIETRLLDCVAYGTEGGPTWVTRRVGLKSGIIRRNAQRSRPMYRFVVLYQNLQPQDHESVIEAFNVCRAGVYGFRLKDWSDFTATDQLIGVATGSEQTVQLAKLYEFGNQNVSRPIRKLVSASLTANGSPLSATIDLNTGMATFTGTAAHIIRWSGVFDVPVMFEQDELLFSANNRTSQGLALTADVSLIEDLDA